jgi:hypothetical protein
MPFCPLLAERLEELGKDIHTLNLEGCHAITGTHTIVLFLSFFKNIETEFLFSRINPQTMC